MKIKYLYIFVLPLVAALLIFSAFFLKSDPQGVGNKGIIKFSHKVHNGNAECVDCHTAVPKSTSLKDNLMPNHDACSSCHDVTDKTKCDKCHYDNIYKPLIQKKSELKFNHEFHLDKQKIKCETCHKGIYDVAYAEDAVQPSPKMETCYSCHNNKSTASNECISCHVSTADLKPQSHKSGDFLHTHKFAAREFNANCIMCHDNASCQECHTGTTMLSGTNAKNDFYQPYSPTNSKDGIKQQQITRVHDLNYRFTHGIDAKGKTAECQSCHQINTFCATCHQSKSGDFSLGGIEPTSHLSPNFMIIGVGSGGGEHATLARRDIETCAACHDVQGGDPTCIQCHTDPDGIQGTNPRTHPRNYMRDVHGDWHTSQGSICFNCHTGSSPSSPAGVGFCGYCHGSNVH
ncbi:MAG TPA: cytochrome c3 family protein [Ignavibacteriaceae bacterium]|nr:cytochrome c3 family protein [Ignavibacteriaceae bacterium]